MSRLLFDSDTEKPGIVGERCFKLALARAEAGKTEEARS